MITTPDEIVQVLSRTRYRYCTEDDLQRAIFDSLRGVADVRREVRMGVDRPDLVVADRIGIEVKIKGGYADALRQVARYLKHPEIESVILVGTCAWLAQGCLPLPVSIEGKPIYYVRLINSLL